jgi:hypothetical protein
MSDLSREDEILCREYQEAGEACRGHDTLVRTGLTVFGAAQAAIIGFIVTRGPSITLELVLLEILGLWLSVVVFFTTRRLHVRYSNYMERARCIERRLGMYLYQYSYEYFGTESVPAKWTGNKKLWASVPALTFVLYLVLLGRAAWPSVRGVICG